MSIRMTWKKKEWHLWWGWSLWWWKRHDKEREREMFSCIMRGSKDCKEVSLKGCNLCVSRVFVSSFLSCSLLSISWLSETNHYKACSFFLTSWLFFSTTSCLILLSSHTFLECDTSFVVATLSFLHLLIKKSCSTYLGDFEAVAE